jgi:ribosomal-protein-alanine N-acetyltransferase
MHNDERVMKTLGGLRSHDKTHEYLRLNLEHWDRYGFGLFILRDDKSGDFVGRSAIRHVSVEGDDEVEIGYALMPEFWGRGLATEVAREMVRLAFSQLQLTELIAFALLGNLASHRVMQKAGGSFERNITHSGQLHVLYRFR